MEDSQHKTTTALKKAYAEIILNTAKESAARVMLSDRKSARFHHDLSETKGEALRLLVRLKHMIDAKTIEADVISSNQQRQIDVLEAQLHEAEDIITDLRSEVRWVRDRLEKAKAFESQERNLVNMEEEEEEETVSAQKVDPEVVVESVNRSSLHDVECENEEKQFDGLSVVDTSKAYESQEQNVVNMEEETVSVHKVDLSLNPDHEERSSLDYVECENDKNLEKAKAPESQERGLVNMEEETVCVQEVADTCKIQDVECENDEKRLRGLSVVDTSVDGDIRIKKLELSRNGCTQRIHALERILHERQSSSSADEEEEQGTTEKDSEEIVSSGNLENTRCLVLALRASSAEVVTLPSNALGIKKTRKLRGRRRKRRFGKPKAKSVRTQSQLIKPRQSQSNVTCSKTSTSDGEDSIETHLSESVEVDDLKTCKELKEDLQLKRTLESGDISINRKEKRSKNMHQTDHLVEACQESNLVSINVEDADIPEKETKIIKQLPRWTPRKEDGLVYVLISCEGEEDSVILPSTKGASSLVNLRSDSRVTAVVSDQISESPPRANVNRLLMYTFQRKRKRGSANIKEDSYNLPRKHQENKAQDQI
ncbi:hypothetical protein Bca4012_013930 [Brassica carinata]|uniref:Uncharacterized protein n=1 Tax=Brassica carinata TaxID=52824 RepID=A0A8X7U317_BRACI|nr:hypothetical protein Bca52824_068385 [Brassica carinata]